MKHYTPSNHPAFDNYLKAVGIILDDTDNDRQMKDEIISNLIAQFESELNNSEDFNEEAFVENLDDPEEYLAPDTGKTSQPSGTASSAPLGAVAPKKVRMQWLRSQPLIDRFQAGTFKDREVAPYFMAYLILMALFGLLSEEGILAELLDEDTPSAYDVVHDISSILIMIFGVLYLKKENRDSFGNGFLIKFFALGWVMMVRMILIVIPSIFVIVVIWGDDLDESVELFIELSPRLIFYWWLGKLFAASQARDIEQDSSGNRS